MGEVPSFSRLTSVGEGGKLSSYTDLLPATATLYISHVVVSAFRASPYSELHHDRSLHLCRAQLTSLRRPVSTEIPLPSIHCKTEALDG